MLLKIIDQHIKFKCNKILSLVTNWFFKSRKKNSTYTKLINVAVQYINLIQYEFVSLSVYLSVYTRVSKPLIPSCTRFFGVLTAALLTHVVFCVQ